MRKAIIIIVAVVVAIAVAAAVGPYFVPSSVIKNYLDKHIGGALGVRVSLEKARFHMLPYPGFVISGLGLISKNAPFQGLPIFRASKVSGSLSPIALIKGDVVTDVEASQATTDCRTSEGTSNLSGLFEPGTGAAEMFASEGDGPVIRKVRMTKAKLNVLSDDGRAVWMMDKMDVTAEDIKMSGGEVNAIVSALGQIVGAKNPDFSLKGRFIFGTAKKEMSFKDVGAEFSGSRFAGSAAVNYAAAPPAFDVHIATAALTMDALEPFLRWAGSELPFGLEWKGQLAADVVVQGGGGTSDIEAQADIMQAEVRTTNGFLKPSGVPLKVSSSVSVSPQTILIKEGKAVVADDGEVVFSGEIGRGAGSSVRIKAKGEGLDAAAAKLLFARLAVFSLLDGLSFDADIAGARGSEKDFTVKGGFKATTAEIAGITLGSVEGGFERTDTGYSFPMFKALYAGSQLSGNASMSTGETTAYKFSVVINRLDCTPVSSLKGAVVGNAQLVVEGETSGIDAVSLDNNLKMTGTFSLPSGSFTALKLAETLFGPETWKMIEGSEGVPVAPAMAEKLAKAGNEALELKTAFEFTSKKGLQLSELKWHNPMYGMELSLTLDKDGNTKGRGKAVVPKLVASKLIADKNMQRTVLTSLGELVLPVIVDGVLPSPVVMADYVGFAETVKSAKKALEPAGPPATVIRTGEQQGVAAKAASAASPAPITTEVPKEVLRAMEKPPETAKGEAPAKKGAPKREEAMSIDEPAADDVLKVIIGK